MNPRRDLRLETLRLQMEHLEILRGRHLNWSIEADDIEASRLHLEIYDAFLAIREKYQKLLDRYALPLTTPGTDGFPQGPDGES